MGVVASTVFMARNIDKCANQKDYMRGGVALCQSVSSADSAAKTATSVFSNAFKGVGNFMSKADGAVDVIAKKVGGEGGQKAVDTLVRTTGAGSKLGAVAQSAVNPLLCVASGIRVLKDDDQYAALIEETAAMGAMFGCEGIMKYARSSITNTGKAEKGIAGLVTKFAEKTPAIKNLSKKAGEMFKKLGEGKNGNLKQTALKIGIDALFVCGSILAFNAGHKLGEKLSHRDKKKS